MNQTLLACPPVAIAQQRELGIVGFAPGPDQTKGECELCQAQVWIGARLRATKAEQPKCVVACFKCALQQPGRLSHRGGKGGSYLIRRR